MGGCGERKVEGECGKGRHDRSGLHQGTCISWHSTEQTQSASLHQESPTHHSQKPENVKHKTKQKRLVLVCCCWFLQTYSRDGTSKQRHSQYGDMWPISSRRDPKNHSLKGLLGANCCEKSGCHMPSKNKEGICYPLKHHSAQSFSFGTANEPYDCRDIMYKFSQQLRWFLNILLNESSLIILLKRILWKWAEGI